MRVDPTTMRRMMFSTLLIQSFTLGIFIRSRMHRYGFDDSQATILETGAALLMGLMLLISPQTALRDNGFKLSACGLAFLVGGQTWNVVVPYVVNLLRSSKTGMTP